MPKDSGNGYYHVHRRKPTKTGRAFSGQKTFPVKISYHDGSVRYYQGSLTGNERELR